MRKRFRYRRTHIDLATKMVPKTTFPNATRTRHGNLETRRLGDTPGHTTCRVPVCACAGTQVLTPGSVCSFISDAAFLEFLVVTLQLS